MSFSGSKLVEKYFKHFLSITHLSLNESKIKTSFGRKGFIRMEDLDLGGAFFNEFQAPFEIKKILIQKVDIQFKPLSLSSEPVVVEVSGVTIVMEIANGQHWNEETCRIAKSRRVRLLQETRARGGGKKKKLPQLVMTILSLLQVHVTDVRIVLIDGLEDAFLLGVSLSSLTIPSNPIKPSHHHNNNKPNKSNKPKPSDKDPNNNNTTPAVGDKYILRKSLQVQRLCVFLEPVLPPHHPVVQYQSQPAKQQVWDFIREWSMRPSAALLSPADISAELVANLDGDDHPNHPRVQLSAAVSRINVEMTSRQMEKLRTLHLHVTQLKVLNQERQFRPACSVDDSPRRWVQYVVALKLQRTVGKVPTQLAAPLGFPSFDPRAALFSMSEQSIVKRYTELYALAVRDKDLPYDGDNRPHLKQANFTPEQIDEFERIERSLSVQQLIQFRRAVKTRHAGLMSRVAEDLAEEEREGKSSAFSRRTSAGTDAGVDEEWVVVKDEDVYGKQDELAVKFMVVVAAEDAQIGLHIVDKEDLATEFMRLKATGCAASFSKLTNSKQFHATVQHAQLFDKEDDRCGVTFDQTSGVPAAHFHALHASAKSLEAKLSVAALRPTISTQTLQNLITFANLGIGKKTKLLARSIKGKKAMTPLDFALPLFAGEYKVRVFTNGVQLRLVRPLAEDKSNTPFLQIAVPPFAFNLGGTQDNDSDNEAEQAQHHVHLELLPTVELKSIPLRPPSKAPATPKTSTPALPSPSEGKSTTQVPVALGLFSNVDVYAMRRNTLLFGSQVMAAKAASKFVTGVEELPMPRTFKFSSLYSERKIRQCLEFFSRVSKKLSASHRHDDDYPALGFLAISDLCKFLASECEYSKEDVVFVSELLRRLAKHQRSVDDPSRHLFQIIRDAGSRSGDQVDKSLLAATLDAAERTSGTLSKLADRAQGATVSVNDFREALGTLPFLKSRHKPQPVASVVESSKQFLVPSPHRPMQSLTMRTPSWVAAFSSLASGQSDLSSDDEGTDKRDEFEFSAPSRALLKGHAPSGDDYVTCNQLLAVSALLPLNDMTATPTSSSSSTATAPITSATPSATKHIISHAAQPIASIKVMYNQFNASNSAAGVSSIDFLWGLVNYGVCKSAHDAAFVLRAALRYVGKDSAVRPNETFDVVDFGLLITAGLVPQDAITHYDVEGYEKGCRCCSFLCSLLVDSFVYPVQLMKRNENTFKMYHLSFQLAQSRFTLFNDTEKLSFSFTDFKRCEIGPGPFTSVPKVRQIFAVTLLHQSQSKDMCIVPRVSEDKFRDIAGVLVNLVNFQDRLDAFKTFVAVENADERNILVGSHVKISVVPRNPAGKPLLSLAPQDTLILECVVPNADGTTTPLTKERAFRQSYRDGVLYLHTSYQCTTTGPHRFTVKKNAHRETVGRPIHSSVVPLPSEFVVSLDSESLPKRCEPNAPVTVHIKVLDSKGGLPNEAQLAIVRKRISVKVSVMDPGSTGATDAPVDSSANGVGGTSPPAKPRSRVRSLEITQQNGAVDGIEFALVAGPVGLELKFTPAKPRVHIIRVLYRTVDVSLSPLAINGDPGMDHESFSKLASHLNLFTYSSPQVPRPRTSISSVPPTAPTTPAAHCDPLPDTGPSITESVINLVTRHAMKDREQTLEELQALVDHLQYEIELLQKEVEPCVAETIAVK